MFINIKESMKNCSEDKVFCIIDGRILRNIYDLEACINGLDETSFRYHVNLDNNKNDFADWLRDVFSEKELADELEGVMDKKEYLKIIKKYISKY